MNISIIIPTLNEEEALPRLLTSIQSQTFPPCDVIIVDGHSHDRTIAVAKSFRNHIQNLSILTSYKRNLSHQRNMGATKAMGDWLMFIDADTVFPSDFIENLINKLIEQPCDACTTLVRPDRQTIVSRVTATAMNVCLSLGNMLGHTTLIGPFSLIQKSIFEACGKYDETCTFVEDMDISLRLKLHKAKISILNTPQYYWSQRRYRTFGYFQTFFLYIKPWIQLLFTGTLPKSTFFQMGGQVFKAKT